MIRRSLWTRCSLLLGFLVILSTGGAAAQGATVAQPVTGGIAARAATTGPGRAVDPRHLPAVAAGNHPALARPFHRDPHQSTAPARTAGVVSPAGAAQTAQPASQTVGTSFAGLSAAVDESLFPFDQAIEPPDVQLAAGPNHLFEMVNSTGAVYTKTGTRSAAYDLNSFFLLPSGYSFTDPHIVYDQQSGRWFATGLAIDSLNDSQVYMAVSTSNDPTLPWLVYTVASNTTGIVFDQPFLGTSDDKIVVSWNDYPSSGFSGAEIWVMEKAQLVAGAASVQEEFFAANLNYFRVVPAKANTTTSAVYAVAHTTSMLQVLTLTGTPAANNVTLAETDLAAAAFSAPPAPVQPGGTTVEGTNYIDNRFLSAVWQNNILWTSAGDGCTPSGDSAVRDCLRLIQVSTASSLPTKSQDFDVGANGSYYYYPAVGVDGSSNLTVVYTASSIGINPSVAITGQAAGTTGAVGPATLVKTGAAPYTFAGFSGGRWGDFLAAAIDPATPSSVWVNGELTTNDASPNWGTQIAQVAFATLSSPPKNLKLTAATPSSTLLTWTAATGNTGIDIVRLSQAGQTILPAGGPLPASTVTFTDTPPSGDQFDCYVVVAVNGSTVQGNSDVLCRFPHVQSATGVPGNFSIALNGTPTSTLTWTAPGGQTSYVLGSITPTVPGSNWLTTNILGTATSTTFNQGPQLTCFVLIPENGTTALGNTDILCSDPGLQSMTAQHSSVSPALPSLPNLGHLRAAAAQVRTTKAR